jgi:thioredoxin-like negative regulator of GroEL
MRCLDLPQRARLHTTSRRQHPATDPTPEKEPSEIFTADDNTFSLLVEQHASSVLVDFYANWCPPCRAIAPILKKVSESEGIRLVKVDVDESQQVAGKYNAWTACVK